MTTTTGTEAGVRVVGGAALERRADHPAAEGWRNEDRRPAYYGQPILKPAPWSDEIAWYFFTGGLAGASSLLAAAADVAGHHTLARHARWWALAGLAPSPVLLVLDLGRKARFANMLRVLKPTSPMSVGSWILAAYSPAAGAAALAPLLGWRRLGLAGQAGAAVLGAGVATYTAVLVADTATPVWHEARRELPFVFAAGAASSAGAAAALSAPLAASGPARALAVGGTLAELGAVRLMDRRLGKLASARRTGRAGMLAKASLALGVTGTALLSVGPRRKAITAAGAGAVLASAACQRLAVLASGTNSALDPTHVLATQGGHAGASGDHHRGDGSGRE